MADTIFRMTEFAGSGRGLKARPYNGDGTLATSANISSIAWAATNADTGAAVGSGSLSPVSSYMTAAATTSDDDPNFEYTFLWDCPGTNWPTAGSVYRVVVVFTPASGNPHKHVWEVTAKSPSQR